MSENCNYHLSMLMNSSLIAVPIVLYGSSYQNTFNMIEDWSKVIYLTVVPKNSYLETLDNIVENNDITIEQLGYVSQKINELYPSLRAK